jgi:hypothetical protein
MTNDPIGRAWPSVAHPAEIPRKHKLTSYHNPERFERCCANHIKARAERLWKPTYLRKHVENRQVVL